MSSHTMESVASEAAACFEVRKRDSGESFTALRDNAPDWVHALVQEAHGEMFPDDWRYQAIDSAVDHISDTGGDEDAHEWADNYVDVYTSARLQWLASHLNRVAYVDDAVDEFGHSDQGIVGDIGVGQYTECVEIYSSVWQSLSERLDELADDDDDDDDESEI